jgi:branched-chain amino acid transport system permease protein
MSVRNRDLECWQKFELHVRRKLRALVNEDLINEHAGSPLGPHSDALSRVLNFLRRGPVDGKFAVFAEKSFGPFRILRLTGKRGIRPVFAEETRFATLDEVYHRIFLYRLSEMLNVEGLR